MAFDTYSWRFRFPTDFNVGTLRALGTLMILITALFWAYKFFIKKWAVYFQNYTLVSLEKWYRGALTFALTERKPYFFLGTVGLLFSSFIILGLAAPKVEFFPENEPQQILIYLNILKELQSKKPMQLLNESKKRFKKAIDQEKYRYEDTNFMIDSNVAVVGAGAQNPETDRGGDQDMPHKAKITLTMTEFKYRRGLSSETMRMEIQQRLKNKFPGIVISVEKMGAGPFCWISS